VLADFVGSVDLFSQIFPRDIIGANGQSFAFVPARALCTDNPTK
jgi:hypothetical protein